jgi:hypothetical protein
MIKWTMALKVLEVRKDKFERIIIVLVDKGVIEDWVNRDSLLNELKSKFGVRAALITEECCAYSDTDILSAIERSGVNLKYLSWKDVEVAA